MRLSKALKEKMMDVRIRDKLVHEGTLSAEQVEKFLGELPDDQVSSTTTLEVEEKVTGQESA